MNSSLILFGYLSALLYIVLHLVSAIPTAVEYVKEGKMDPFRSFSGYSLAEMDQAYRQGLISADELTDYLAAWNAFPGRFTVAEYRDGAIRNAPKQARAAIAKVEG